MKHNTRSELLQAALKEWLPELTLSEEEQAVYALLGEVKSISASEVTVRLKRKQIILCIKRGSIKMETT
jgi:hypothetical protein